MSATTGIRIGLSAAVGALALGVLVWTATLLPASARNERVTSVANAIIRGSSFQPEVLQVLIGKTANSAGSGAVCDASRLEALSILRLRLFEMALASGDTVSSDQARVALVSGVTDLLRCAPRGGFWWFVLFWTRNTSEGFDPATLPFLEASYRLAPREGWISVRRSKLATGILRFASPELEAGIAREFSELLENGHVDAASAILNGPRDERRDWAVALVNRLDPVRRNQAIRRFSIRSVDLAGVNDPDGIAASVAGPKWYRDVDVPIGQGLLSSSTPAATIPLDR